MFTKTLLIATLLAVAPLASASPVEDLARETGLSERNVRMLMGAHTPYGDYRISYDSKLRQFKKALGESNYQRLMNGQTIVLERKVGVEQRAIAKADADKP